MMITLDRAIKRWRYRELRSDAVLNTHFNRPSEQLAGIFGCDIPVANMKKRASALLTFGSRHCGTYCVS